MLDENTKSELLKIARTAIMLGAKGKKLEISNENYAPILQVPGASFVTLKINGQLQGCIGSLQARRPLAEDVAENAYAAAFEDSRFLPVMIDDVDKLSIQISILSEPEKIEFSSEQDLIKQLRPGEDGLILQDNLHRGTFLPTVWEQLPGKKEFLMHLKRKAGLDEHYWSDDLSIERYTTESFSEN